MVLCGGFRKFSGNFRINSAFERCVDRSSGRTRNDGMSGIRMKPRTARCSEVFKGVEFPFFVGSFGNIP